MIVGCLLSDPSSASRLCVPISREFILTIGKNSSLSSLCEVWCELVDTLGIAKSGSHSPSQWDACGWKKGRRKRGGRQAKRAREVKKFLSFGLVNARSVCCKPDVITHHLLSNRLDILAITETWLTVQHGEDILRGICPDGFVAVHNPRVMTSGGGVALLFRSTIRVGCLFPVNFTASSFEYLATSLTVNSVCLRVVVIYRSTRENASHFLPEFSNFLDLLVLLPGRLLIVGDFNIHVDNLADSTAIKFLSIVESHGLFQHVSESTHIKGHILDLVLTRVSDNLVIGCEVEGLISDHLAVTSLLQLHRPLRPQRSITYRKLKSIDPVRFREDLISMPLISNQADNIDGIVEQYNTSIAHVLEKHAPLIKKIVTIRSDNPWLTDEIRLARRRARKLERRWRLRGLEFDKEELMISRDDLRRLIKEAKESFLNSKIAECSGKKSLFKIVDSFLLKKTGLKLPQHVSLANLLNDFGCFFSDKISDIRASLDAEGPLAMPEEPRLVNMFTSFSQVTVSEVAALLDKCPSKSSLRDPIPTFLLKEFSDILVHPITNVINLSLSSGIFPDEMKLAFVTPLLKKSDLDPNKLCNYRPVSNLSFLSKLVERVCVKQIMSHLQSSNLLVPVQSAYRPDHSTETALLRVMNDLLMAVDGENAAILELLD